MVSTKGMLMVLLASLLLLLAVGCSDDDDDNGTGPDIQPFTPAVLVGTWDWSYITEDGVTYSDFADYSFTDTSTAQELQFMPGGSWETREYYNGAGPVYTRSGTCYEDDSLYIKTTNENGTPVEGFYQGADWEVAGSVLTLRYEVIIPDTDTIRLASYYTKQ